MEASWQQRNSPNIAKRSINEIILLTLVHTALLITYYYKVDNKNYILGVYPKEWKAGAQRDICTRMLIAASFQKVEATQMLMGRLMDKQNVVYTYSDILFSLKKEGNSDTCYNMDEP